MIEKIKELLIKYREIIVYLIVGVMTTVFSWGVCYIAKLFLNPDINGQNVIINTMGWVGGVCFAYPLNRKWVFRSKNSKILEEFFGFAGSRLSTWILEIVLMLLTYNKMGMEFWIAKFCVAIVVTILNYVFSKLLIFKKKPKTED